MQFVTDTLYCTPLICCCQRF